MLGTSAGTVASGSIRLEPATGTVLTGYFSWLAPFPLAIGLLTLALCCFMAAVYLANEAPNTALQEDFRLRALISAGMVGVLAWLALYLAHAGAPRLAVGLMGQG